MNVDELVTAVRISGGLPEADPTFTDARIREELHNALTTGFERPIVNSRQGFWRKVRDYTTGTTRFRVPDRSIAGSVESVEIFETGSEPSPEAPRVPDYRFESDHIVLSQPLPSGYTLRLRYYLRPSRFEGAQSAGIVTAVTATTLTLNSLPTVGGVPLASGARVDVIHPGGWYELPVVNVAATIAALVLTFPADTDLSLVEVGDYVRAAGYTDWPCLPEDFHRTLADTAAMTILISKGDLQKVSILSARVQQDLERLTDLMSPRTMNRPPATRARYGIVRGSLSWRGRVPG